MATQLVNCKRCGKLFLRVKHICPDCYNKQEEDYKKIVDHLRDFPGCTIQELSDATTVSIGQIREFIMAGRIISNSFKNLTYSCESCGAQIQSGKLCTNCMNTIGQLSKRADKIGINKTNHTTVKKVSSGYKTREL